MNTYLSVIIDLLKDLRDAKPPTWYWADIAKQYPGSRRAMDVVKEQMDLGLISPDDLPRGLYQYLNGE